MADIPKRSLFDTLSSDDLARLEIMRAVRSKYLTSDRDKELQEGLKFLVEVLQLRQLQDGSGIQKFEPRAMLIEGGSGSGKSSALQRLLFQLGLPDLGQASCEVISLTVKSPCTLKSLGQRLLSKLGYPIEATSRTEYEIWDRVFKQIARLGTKIIHFDEMQNVFERANRDEALRIRDMLKSFLNVRDGSQTANGDAAVCLILSGLSGLHEFIELDTQTRRRVRFIRFSKLSMKDSEDIIDAIDKLAGMANLGASVTRDFIPVLVHAALGEFGLTIEMTCNAIDDALMKNDAVLTSKNFANQYAKLTGNSASENPFLADNWHEIDCRRVLLSRRSESQPEDEPVPVKQTRQRKEKPDAKPKQRRGW